MRSNFPGICSHAAAALARHQEAEDIIALRDQRGAITLFPET